MAAVYPDARNEFAHPELLEEGWAPWTAPEEVKVAGADERALIWRGGETIDWRVV